MADFANREIKISIEVFRCIKERLQTKKFVYLWSYAKGNFTDNND
jgi:hypothetical protein